MIEELTIRIGWIPPKYEERFTPFQILLRGSGGSGVRIGVRTNVTVIGTPFG